MGVTINGYELPLHISYSAFSTYTECGQKYYLTRVVKVSEPPAWYFVGGSAVHLASEKVDEMIASGAISPNSNLDLLWVDLFRDAWDIELAKSVEENPNIPFSDYKAGGRVSKAWPEKENADWWLANGPDMVKNWYVWRKSTSWSLWSPEGRGEAVELGIELPVGTDFMVRMFIDRVFVTQDGELVVVDLKTGSRTPTSDMQLAIYAAGIEKHFGVRPKYGTYWMGRSGACSPLVDLDHLSTDKVLSAVSSFDFARKSGIFLPNLSNCNYCSVAKHCEWSNK